LPEFVAQWVVAKIVARIQRKRAAARAALPQGRPP